MLENFALYNLIPALFVSLTFLFFEMIMLIIKGQGSKIFLMFKAMWWNIANLGRTLQRRKDIQSKRIVTDRELKQIKIIDSFATSIREYLFLRKTHLKKSA